MNRTHLAQSFRIEIKSPDSQAVLLSLVQQMVSGDVGAVRNDVKVNNYFEPASTSTKTSERSNNFMGETKQTVPEKKTEPAKAPFVPPPVNEDKPSKNNPNANLSNSVNSNS